MRSGAAAHRVRRGPRSAGRGGGRARHSAGTVRLHRAAGECLCACRRSCPSGGQGAGDEDEELLKALDALNAGKKPPQVAADLFGADEVEANWYNDGGLRAKTRRRIDKANARMKGGYKKLAAQV